MLLMQAIPDFSEGPFVLNGAVLALVGVPTRIMTFSTTPGRIFGFSCRVIPRVRRRHSVPWMFAPKLFS